jgi:hemerythrin
MEKIRITNGVYWVEIPEADLFILCGCPADSVKHLMKLGLIVEREKNGVSAQTGPNAILLSDTTIQQGSFSNLAEFPVLQMLYLQGMILPGHPNNTGRKPMLIGVEDQVRSQSAYIYRGTYGLASLSEIVESGVPEAQARDMLRIKRWFAFDNIRRTEDLLDLRVVDAPAIELRGGAFVRRRGFNKYEFIHGGSSTIVDLNLRDAEEYPSTYQLGFQKTRKEYFSVIHIGEGDGWDVNRPCMASIVCFQGRLYLVDAGPGIQHSLTALGISINEVAGIFHTHAHDDHFAGLTSLMRAEHRIAYYATPPVRASVVKKYAALTGRGEASFAQFFDARDLLFDEWNPVEGLEVMPVFSPHPVETNVFFFRAFWDGGHKIYAHLADLSSFEVLRKMTTDDPKKNGISQSFYDACTKKMLVPADAKKIDIGGGLIHGMAQDFADDASSALFLSHTSMPLTDAQKEIGSCAVFGQAEVLIPAQCDALLMDARRHLESYFPAASPHDIQMLANCPLAHFMPNAMIQRVEAPVTDVYLLLSGVAELIDSKTGMHNMLSAGALIGDLEGLTGDQSRTTCRAANHASAIRIPRSMYVEFARRAGLEDLLQRVRENRRLLQGSWLFGEMVSFPAQCDIASRMKRRAVREGDVLCAPKTPEVLLLAEGLVTVFWGQRPIDNLKPGGFFGEETVLRGMRRVPLKDAVGSEAGMRSECEDPGGTPALFEARALLDSTLFAIPGEALENIPIVQWKLMETFERRLKSHQSEFRFQWHESFAVGIPDLDEQHEMLFEMIDGLDAAAAGREPGDGIPGAVDRFVAISRSHLQYEETLAGRSAGSARAAGYDSAAREHAEFLRKLEGLRKYLERAPADTLRTMIDFLKDWVLDHTLLENRRFREALKS